MSAHTGRHGRRGAKADLASPAPPIEAAATPPTRSGSWGAGSGNPVSDWVHGREDAPPHPVPRTAAAPAARPDHAGQRARRGLRFWRAQHAVATVGANESGAELVGAGGAGNGTEAGSDTDGAAPGGRRWLLFGPRRAASTEADVEVRVVDLEEIAVPEPQGYVLRGSPRKARRGWYAPLAAPALTSTRQAEVLNTALIAAPTDARGIIVGRDTLSNTPVAHDAFTAYEEKQISSPNVIVIGVVGTGKSSLLKTVYVLRHLILRNRRAVVMDKKDRGGEGEYCELSREMGAEPCRMVLGGGGTILNILDPGILRGAGRSGQALLLIALAELANNSVPLDKWEKAALRAAHKATLRAADAEGRVPLLADLLPQLGKMHPDFDDHSAMAKEVVHQAGLGVRHMLSAMLADELSGLFDGPTSPNVALADKLTVFDVSQLPEDGPAVSMVMTVANAWLLGTLKRHRGLRTNFIAEEGWNLIGGPGGRFFKSNSKISRGLGMCNIAAVHHPADIPEGDPAIAMMKEAQTLHLFRQDRDEDVEAVIRLGGLDGGSRGTLSKLEQGHHLMKIGDRREIHVEHIRSESERRLTYTDEAMVGAR